SAFFALAIGVTPAQAFGQQNFFRQCATTVAKLFSSIPVHEASAESFYSEKRADHRDQHLQAWLQAVQRLHEPSTPVWVVDPNSNVDNPVKMTMTQDQIKKALRSDVLAFDVTTENGQIVTISKDRLFPMGSGDKERGQEAYRMYWETRMDYTIRSSAFD